MVASISKPDRREFIASALLSTALLPSREALGTGDDYDGLDLSPPILSGDAPRVLPEQTYIDLKETNKTIYKDRLTGTSNGGTGNWNPPTEPFGGEHQWSGSFPGFIFPKHDIKTVRASISNNKEADAVLMVATAAGLDPLTLNVEGEKLRDTDQFNGHCLSQTDIDYIDKIATTVHNLYLPPGDKQGLMRLFIIEGLYKEPEIQAALNRDIDPRDIAVAIFGLFQQKGTGTYDYRGVPEGGVPKYKESQLFPWQIFDSVVHIHNRSVYCAEHPLDNTALLRVTRQLLTQYREKATGKDAWIMTMYGKLGTQGHNVRAGELPEETYSFLPGMHPDNNRFDLESGLLINDLAGNLLQRLTGKFPEWMRRSPVEGISCIDVVDTDFTLDRRICYPVPVGCAKDESEGITLRKFCNVSDEDLLTQLVYQRRSRGDLFNLDLDFPGLKIPTEDLITLNGLIPDNLSEEEKEAERTKIGYLLLYCSAGLMDPLTLRPEGTSRTAVWGAEQRPENLEVFNRYVDKIVGWKNIQTLATETTKELIRDFPETHPRTLALRHKVIGLPDLNFHILENTFDLASRARYGYQSRAHNDSVNTRLLLKAIRGFHERGINPIDLSRDSRGNRYDFMYSLKALPLIWKGQPTYSRGVNNGGAIFAGCTPPVII